MRAVKGKDNLLSFLHSHEARIFNLIELNDFLDMRKLSERDLYIAEELFKKNVIQKINKGDTVGYKVYQQRYKL